MSNRRSVRVMRDSLFALPDARGNNPHGTREQAEQEGQRLNAGRYETVGQIERALDVRAARPSAPSPFAPRPSSGLDFGSIVLLGIIGLAVYAVTRSPGLDDDEEDGDADETPSPVPQASPAPQASPVVVVQPSPPALPAPVAPTIVQPLVQNPAPVIEVVAEPVEPRRRRRRRVKVEPTIVTVATPASPATSPTEK